MPASGAGALPSQPLGRRAGRTLALVGLLAQAGCGGSTARPDTAPAPAAATPRSGFVAVTPGVRLHYVDWGGRGEPLLLLPGLYGTAEIYSELRRDEVIRLVRGFLLGR
jgi:hypothetical protein